MDLNQFNLKLYFLKNSKRIVIRIKPNGVVRVSAPVWIDKLELNQFLLQKKQWIHEKINEINIKSHTQLKLKNNEKINFLDQEYTLKIYQGQLTLKEDLNFLHIWLPSLDEKILKKILIKWYQEKILTEINKEINFFSLTLKKIPRSVSLKSYRARWGACSSRGDLIFNWQIALLQHQQFRYVVAHEMCHLIEMNHSKKFYTLLNNLGFDTKLFNKEMKNLKNVF